MDKNEGAHYINSAPENTITFFAEGGEWVMRITKDCISVNDNVSVDDAAQAVVAAIGRYLNKMTDDRERICAKSIKETWDESQDVGDKKTVDDDLNNVRWKAAYRYDKDKNGG